MKSLIAEDDFVQQAFEYGCDAYASKPVNTKKLLEVMEKLGVVLEKEKE